MRCLVPLLVLATGCDRLLGLEELPLDGAIAIDAPGADDDVITSGDAVVGGGDAMPCFGKYGMGGLLQVCGEPKLGAITLNGALDTTDDPMCADIPQSDGTHVCAIIAAQITVSTFDVKGSRALVLVSMGQLTVNGTLAVKAGQNWSGCAAAGVGIGFNSVGSGGAGGTFRGAGGQGGGSSNATGGVPKPPTTPQTVRGGCAGGKGGTGVGGSGGAGGGAVYLISATKVLVNGRIDVSGLGGGGGAPNGTGGGGGGGGGSGGLIGLDSPMVQIAQGATLIANGGGGGGGGEPGFVGGMGQTTNYATASTPPPGGSGNTLGGDGGAGAAGGQFGGANGGDVAGGTMNSGGGGGGGGGSGAVRLYYQSLTLAGGITPTSATN